METTTTDRRTDVLRASPRMFESSLLDKLSRVHPSVPVILFLPAILVLLGLGIARMGVLPLIGLFAGGYAFWTLMEYWIHRGIFHFEPEEGFGARLHWIIHGVHHDHPNDPMRLVMPPSVSVPLSSLFCLGFYVVLGSPRRPAFSSECARRNGVSPPLLPTDWCVSTGHAPALLAAAVYRGLTRVIKVCAYFPAKAGILRTT